MFGSKTRLALALAAIAAASAAGAGADPSERQLLPPFRAAAAAITCSDSAAPAAIATPDGIELCAAATAAGRLYWDIPLVKIPPDTTTLAIETACGNPAAVRAVTIHLKSGAGWFAAEVPPPSTTGVTCTATAALLFKPEGAPSAWHKARLLRLSLWLRADVAGPAAITLRLRAVTARRDAVAIVRGSGATAPGEEPFAAQMADRAAALLQKAGVPFTFVSDALDANAGQARLLLLPYNPAISGSRLEMLLQFVRKGGKLVVFYNASAPLAETLGIRSGPWMGAARGHEWYDFITTDNAPRLTIPHRTANLMPPQPAADGGAVTVAAWRDSAGQPTAIPACVITARGAWFAHVPPLAYPAASAFMRRIITRLLPAMPLAELPAVAPPRLTPPAATSEIRAFWDSRHDGFSAHFNTLFATAAQNGINTIYRHMQSGNTLHVAVAATDSPAIPRLDAMRKAASDNRVALHAWVSCWTLDNPAPEARAALAAAGRLMNGPQGNTLDWLSPSHPQNRREVLENIAALAANGVDGIHLDYLRYPENGCYAPATRRAFEAWRKAPLPDWPAAVLPGGGSYAEFRQFREHEITSFAAAVTQRVRSINPAITVSAAVYPDPAVALSLGQDWPRWISEKLVDYVCPMTYTENPVTFNAWADACEKALGNETSRLVAGIGTGADESQLDTAGAAGQINASRLRHWRGFAFFARDSALMETILPALSLNTAGAAAENWALQTFWWDFSLLEIDATCRKAA